jgi:hypothetical protein
LKSKGLALKKDCCKENNGKLANGLTSLDSQIKLALKTLKDDERSSIVRAALE